MRDVEENDFLNLGLPFCDVVLSSLSIGPRPLTPPFGIYHNVYSTTSGLSEITVSAAVDDDETVRLLDENGDEIPDSDEDLQGHQVDIDPGVTTIEVEVASEDGQALNVYTVTVTYEDLVVRYDVNDNGAIDRDEAIVAVSDYFNGVIGRDEVIEVIRLYFSS